MCVCGWGVCTGVHVPPRCGCLPRLQRTQGSFLRCSSNTQQYTAIHGKTYCGILRRSQSKQVASPWPRGSLPWHRRACQHHANNANNPPAFAVPLADEPAYRYSVCPSSFTQSSAYSSHKVKKPCEKAMRKAASDLKAKRPREFHVGQKELSQPNEWWRMLMRSSSGSSQH